MWNFLRELRGEGFHFRRQVPLGRYHADFACHHAKLVIEIDGDTHYTREGIEHDLRRDHFIRGEGYRVVRYTNTDILQNLDGIATRLLNLLAELPLRPGSRPAEPDQSPSELPS
jgi:very-short-patch-repair endonuclease